jgi:hypothetical protein
MVPEFAKGLYLLFKGGGYDSIMWAEAEPARAARRVADVVACILSGGDEICMSWEVEISCIECSSFCFAVLESPKNGPRKYLKIYRVKYQPVAVDMTMNVCWWPGSRRWVLFS